MRTLRDGAERSGKEKEREKTKGRAEGGEGYIEPRFDMFLEGYIIPLP
jgi:hypothetical protein